MRAIWSGAIGFGLVNIPVKLYSAVQQSELDLDMLDKKDHANIKFKRVNANTGKEVAWENIVRGYKMDEHYVVLTPEDFERASPEKTKLIGIEEFVQEKEISKTHRNQKAKVTLKIIFVLQCSDMMLHASIMIFAWSLAEY